MEMLWGSYHYHPVFMSKETETHKFEGHIAQKWQNQDRNHGKFLCISSSYYWFWERERQREHVRVRIGEFDR